MYVGKNHVQFHSALMNPGLTGRNFNFNATSSSLTSIHFLIRTDCSWDPVKLKNSEAGADERGVHCPMSWRDPYGIQEVLGAPTISRGTEWIRIELVNAKHYGHTEWCGGGTIWSIYDILKNKISNEYSMSYQIFIKSSEWYSQIDRCL